MFEYTHSSFPNRKRSPEYPIFSETRGRLQTLGTRECLWTVRPAFNFPGWLGHHWTRFRLWTLRRHGHHWTLQRRGCLNCSTGLQLSGLEFFRLLFEFNLRFNRQFSSDTEPFKPFTCILALSIDATQQDKRRIDITLYKNLWYSSLGPMHQASYCLCWLPHRVLL